MTTGVLHIPLTAFNAYGTGLGVSAHNLANVLTTNFRAGGTTYADLPGTSGVAASTSTSLAARSAKQPLGTPGAAFTPSNTDVAKEMVNMIATSRTYQANAKIVSTADSLLGMVIDMAV